MTAIPISQSVTRATDRLETVLNLFLPQYLEERESADYPLPKPEAWVMARIDLNRHWRALNIDEVLGLIVPVNPASVRANYSGDGERWSRGQQASYEVTLLIRAPQAYPNVQRNGRNLIESEWLQYRAELYRGALCDVVTRYSPDPDNIHGVEIETYEAGIFEQPDLGSFIHASCRFSVYQDVLIDM